MTATSPLDRDRPSLLRSYCQLLRLPNIFTAMADVAMGFLVVQAIWLNAPKVPHTSPLGCWGFWRPLPVCSTRPAWY